MRAHISAAVAFIYLTLWPGADPAQTKAPTQPHAPNVAAMQAGPVLATVYDDITVIGMHPPAGVAFNVPILGPGEALEKITKALALIKRESSYSATRIETLKKNGSVLIVYDPRYPDRNADLATVQVALFLPKFFAQGEDVPGKSFLVVVGRHGIKWPLPELAAVLVHELVGHGMQHLEDRLETMRSIDSECEAWLYTEMAHQNLGMDKFARGMIEFQKQLAYQCDNFLRHLRKNDPAGLKLWEVLNPDVPKLLGRFEVYLDDLRRRGVMRDAIRFAKKLRETEQEKIFREGEPGEQNMVGVWYRNGVGQPPDHVKAIRWFLRAADQGHAEAQFNLGVLYEKGKGVAKDDAKAASWYQKAAAQGIAESQYALGVLYETGRGVSRNEDEAAAWYGKAAVRIDTFTLNNLGFMFERGRGFSKDETKAVKLYRKAARLGHPIAQHNIGVMYREGRGVARDDAEARKWVRRAAEQGFIPAQVYLARIFAKGEGVPKDNAEAARWYRMAAEQNYPHAQNALGFMYRKGRGVPRDYKEAVRWYRKAAEQGYVGAQSSLAFMYKKGWGVPQDNAEAARWYRMAAEQNYPHAQDALGFMYRKGWGVPRDYKEAMRWYRKAAEQGYAIAQISLGFMYEKGLGVPRDNAEAARWYRMAAEQGNKFAIQIFDRLKHSHPEAVR